MRVILRFDCLSVAATRSLAVGLLLPDSRFAGRVLGYDDRWFDRCHLLICGRCRGWQWRDQQSKQAG